ncbi:MAG TPA: prenyltransferase/squalene oxidase repeat-containing protein, partial [Gemmataceae bacterium]|nr:prenyltransferase/squalene oxidase repeat-containing protein [Gemmataceae bacterium]
MRKSAVVVSAAALVVAVALLGSHPGRAEEIAPEYRKAISKGLDWLAKDQHRDGHWDASGGQYPVAMTGLSGIALLMEGSTIRDGKYAENIRRATDWLMSCTQRTGLISPLANNGRGYMHDHGYALLFLACVYGEEEDSDRRRKLEGILTRAVDFTGKAQSSKGGWYYTSRQEGGDSDEGSTTITQVQALRACRNAGIVVPKGIIEKSQEYLKKCTTEHGGVIYSLSSGGGGERPALTAAAIACAFNSGEYNAQIAKRWLKYCQTAIPILGGNRMGHDEYTQYYYAQVAYMLGEEGYGKLFPDSRASERLTW